MISLIMVKMMPETKMTSTSLISKMIKMINKMMKYFKDSYKKKSVAYLQAKTMQYNQKNH